MNINGNICNPFLPIDEYIPDGEPHVFGDRVYIFGSHDMEGGYTFCMRDYVTYSAPVDDLTDWRYEGVIYRADQDPDYPNRKYMYAPDVVQGNDGRFYLYYGMGGDYGYGGYNGPISVAVSDKAAGLYEYLGFVKNPDGSPMQRFICFDPAVINDDGVIRLYYGTQYSFEEEPGFLTNGRLEDEMKMFNRSREEILSYWGGVSDAEGGSLISTGDAAYDSINGPSMLILEDDMVTVKVEAKHIIPYKVKGTSFEEHPFFEGASIRKVGDKYYFIYSSWLNHELCYAVSDKPDEGFVFGGTIVSNGDVGYEGREAKDRLNMTGTTHGSIENINGKWYVFFHRLTHKSDYSRQACAEEISIAADGSIKQVELTSCGLNGGPLPAEGAYPAVICCNLTNHRMPHGSNSIYKDAFPNVTHRDDDRFIGEIEDGTLIGYKYFDFKGVEKLAVTARAETPENLVVLDVPLRLDERCDEKGFERAVGDDADKNTGMGGSAGTGGIDGDRGNIAGTIELRLEPDGESVGRLAVPVTDDPFAWLTCECKVNIPDGIHALYLIYHGAQKIQLNEIVF